MLRERVRHSQRKYLKLLPAASFHRLVQGLSAILKGFGVHGAAVEALLEEWVLCALHAKGPAIQIADVMLVRLLF